MVGKELELNCSLIVKKVVNKYLFLADASKCCCWWGEKGVADLEEQEEGGGHFGECLKC